MPSSRVGPRRRSSQPTTARSSCESSPTCPATSNSPTRSPRGRHPPRDGSPRPAQGRRRRHGRRAVDGQDGQLRARLRDERLRALVAGRDLAPGRPGVHQLLLRGVRRDQPLHAPHPRDGTRDGYVATLLGRKRKIPELEARNPSLRAAGERMAINMPIQGTAADIVKIAMIRTDRALQDGIVPLAGPALGPRRAPPRGAARRGGPADPGAARGDGGRAAALGAADRRGQGGRLVGGHGAGPRRDAAWRRLARPPRRSRSPSQ